MTEELPALKRGVPRTSAPASMHSTSPGDAAGDAAGTEGARARRSSAASQQIAEALASDSLKASPSTIRRGSVSAAFPIYQTPGARTFASSPHEAAETGALVALREFMAKDGYDVEQRDVTGRTCLMWAAESDHVDCIKELLDAGANVAAADPFQGRTAMHLAARAGSAEALRAMVAKLPAESRLDEINRKDNLGQVPLFLASQKGEQTKEAFSYLLSVGALYNCNKVTMKTAGNVVLGAMRWKKKTGLGGMADKAREADKAVEEAAGSPRAAPPPAASPLPPLKAATTSPSAAPLAPMITPPQTPPPVAVA